MRSGRGQKIKQLEQKWGSEVKALKQAHMLQSREGFSGLRDRQDDYVIQDLHRTILAHNHNSDLMRHHRDALDEDRI